MNFDDVGEFHDKFKLDNVTNHGAGPRPTPHGLMKFRLQFMLEELLEFAEATNFVLGFNPDTGKFEFNLPGQNAASRKIDHDKAFDALLDLAYVVFGSAQVLGYPWQEGWEEVQRVNMSKERCELDHAFVPPVSGLSSPDYTSGCYHRTEEGLCGQPRHKHSLRGNINDVIKPLGWTPPDIKGILKRHGFDVKD